MHAKIYLPVVPLILLLVVIPSLQAAKNTDGVNLPGHYLISDQLNNRVIEVNSSHHIVWRFGTGSNVAGSRTCVGVNDAQRVGTLTLMACTSIPAGLSDSCTNPDGCLDNRVILVTKTGKIVWQYGKAGVAGSGFNELSFPVQATFLPNHHVLITDQGNQRVIQIGKHRQIVWQYGTTGVDGDGANELSDPNSAELLDDGNVLIADEGNNRVIEVTHTSSPTIVWQYPTTIDTSLLSGPAFASRLPNNNTLITDSGNNRVIEVTRSGTVVFTYVTNTRTGSIDSPSPSRAVRRRNGNTVISDQFNNQVIEVTPAGKIVFTQGEIAVAASTFNRLNGPYDAKVIGDYTGLTAPHPGHRM